MASSVRLKVILASLCPAVVVALGGCLLKPEYERTQVITENTFRDTPVTAETIANLKWWEIFKDKQLTDLITTALKENRNLMVAMARIEQARAQVGVVRPDQFPITDAQGTALRTSTNVVAPDAVPPQDYFLLLAPLKFEVDLWGKYSSATEAKRAEMLSSEQSYRAVTLTLVSQVADTYLQLLNFDRQLIIAERTFANRKHYTDIIRERFQGGYTNQLDLNQAEIQQQNAAAAVVAIQRQIRVLENSMSVLIGHTPQPIKRSPPDTNPIAITSLPAGAPAMLLERRPDVRAAEESARSAIMQVGVARSTQYPNISLNGMVGLASGDISELFSADGRVWSYGGQFLGPLMDFGKSWSRTSAAEAQAEQLVKQYEQVVLEAVRDIEDAMIAIRTYDQENKIRTAQVASASNGDKLAHARYDNGIASFLEVLNTQTSLFDSQIQQSLSLQLYLSSIVQLYKALGGGWEQPGGEPVKLPEHGWEFYQ